MFSSPEAGVGLSLALPLADLPAQAARGPRVFRAGEGGGPSALG